MPTILLLASQIFRPSYGTEYHIKIEQSVKDRQIMFFLKHELVIFDLIFVKCNNISSHVDQNQSLYHHHCTHSAQLVSKA